MKSLFAFCVTMCLLVACADVSMPPISPESTQIVAEIIEVTETAVSPTTSAEITEPADTVDSATSEPPTPTASPTATIASTQPPTIVPTPITPAPLLPAIWTTIGTPMPPAQAILSPENITQIQEVGRWGKGKVIDAKYSPDGTELAVATALGVYVYDAETAVQRSFIPVENIQLASMAISPDWQWVAMGIEPDQIKIRQLSDGHLLNTFIAPYGVQALTFTADGQHLLAPYTAWRMSDGVEIPSTYDMSMLSADGETVAIYADRKYELAKLAVGSEVTLSRTGVIIPIDSHIEFYNRIKGTLSPDGKLLAFGADYTVEVYRVSDGALLKTITNPVDYEVMGLQFAPDSQTLAATGYWETSLWDVTNEQLLRRIPDAHDKVAFSIDGSRIAAWSDTLTQWKLPNGTRLNQVKQHAGQVNDLDFTSTTSHLAIASNYLYLRNMVDGGLLTSYPDETQNVAITPDDQTLLSTSGEELILRDLLDGSSFSVLVGGSLHIWVVDDFDLSNDGKIVATTANGEDVNIWRVNDGHLLSSGYSMNGVIVEFSPMGTTFASLSHNGDAVELWPSPPLSETLETSDTYNQMREEMLIRSFALSDWLNSLAFSPDGSLLLAGVNSGLIYVWQVADGKLVTVLQSQAYGVTGLTFSPDGELLASASEGGTLNFWRVTDWQLLNTILFPRSRLLSAEFSPNGRYLATGSRDGLVRIWGVPLNQTP